MWVRIRIPKGIIEIHPTYVTQLTRNGFIKSPFRDEEKEDT